VIWWLSGFCLAPGIFSVIGVDTTQETEVPRGAVIALQPAPTAGAAGRITTS
jgi:hypothetical protein